MARNTGDSCDKGVDRGIHRWGDMLNDEDWNFGGYAIRRAPQSLRDFWPVESPAGAKPSGSTSRQSASSRKLPVINTNSTTSLKRTHWSSSSADVDPGFGLVTPPADSPQTAITEGTSVKPSQIPNTALKASAPTPIETLTPVDMGGGKYRYTRQSVNLRSM